MPFALATFKPFNKYINPTQSQLHLSLPLQASLQSYLTNILYKVGIVLGANNHPGNNLHCQVLQKAFGFVVHPLLVVFVLLSKLMMYQSCVSHIN